MPRTLRRLATVLLLASAACSSAPSAAPVSSPVGSPSPSPTVAVSASPGASCAEQVLTGMDEEQRVGQLFLLGLASNRLGPAETSAILAHHIGSVWFTETSSAGVSGIRAVASAVQAQASGSATGGVRFFVAANQEGGQVQALGGAGFSRIPSAVDQGGTDPAALESSAAGWARELLAAGVNMNFAPVLDVVPPGTDASNQPIGVLRREYGHDPATAGSHGAALLRGMQVAGVATTIKHFPGLGRVAGNTDVVAGVVDRTTTSDDPYLASFKQGIDARAPFVMVALATYTRIDANHLAVFSPAVMGQLLRARLGFAGVVMSDDMGATAAVASVPAGTRAVDFLAAGGDMIISKTVSPTLAMVATILARVATDAGFRARVDDATLRVLRAKQAYGLLPCS